MLDQLLPELQREVIQYLSIRDMLSVRMTSKALKCAVDSVLVLPLEGRKTLLFNAGSLYHLNHLGQVYVCGNNNHGQLGLGNIQNPLSLTLIDAKHFNQQKVFSMKTHDDSAFFLSKEGGVFVCGNNKYGQLGLGDTQDRHFPVRIDPKYFGNQKIISIKTHNGSVFYLTEKSEVYVCGKNKYGQLGLSHECDQHFPMRIDPDYFAHKEIASIAFHSGAALFLTKDGHVYSCGSNNKGQTGHRKGKKSKKTPTLINPKHFRHQAIVKVITHSGGTLFLTLHGEVFGCGDGEDGRLGRNTTNPRETPAQIAPNHFAGQPVTDIIMRGKSSLCVCANGDIYGWGDNKYGQLGLLDTENRLTPTAIDLRHFGGQSVTFIKTHNGTTFFLCADGTVRGCGHNDAYQLGLKPTTSYTVPTLLDLPHCVGQRVVEIVTHEGTTFFQLDTGDILGCGINANSVLGATVSGKYIIPTLVSGMNALAYDLLAVRERLLGLKKALNYLKPNLGNKMYKHLALDQCSLPRFPKSLLFMLHQIRSKLDSKNFKGIAFPQKALIEDEKKHVSVNPLLFSAANKMLPIITKLEQEKTEKERKEQEKHASREKLASAALGRVKLGSVG